MENTLTIIGGVVTTLLAVIIALGAAWYKWRKGVLHATDEALNNYIRLADSRKAMIDQLTTEKAELCAEMAQVESHLKECKELRDEFAKSNLRLQAREQIYQACINRLELRLDLPPTNFEPLSRLFGPNQH